MAIKANSSATRVSYINETITGTTPATPAWQPLRVTGEDFDFALESKISEELDPSRNVIDSVIASGKSSGGAKFEFSPNSFDSIMSKAVGGTWATDVLMNGKDEQAMSVEVVYETGATDIYKRLRGCFINSLNLEFKPGEIVKGSFDVLGGVAEYDTAAIAGATYPAASTESVLAASNDFGSFVMTGQTIDCITSLTMKWDNKLRPRYCLNGSVFPESIGFGNFDCSGEMELYLDASKKPFLDAMKNNTATGIEFILGTVANKKTKFEIPRIKITSAKVMAEGQNQDVMIKATWQASKSTALSGNTVRITRNMA